VEIELIRSLSEALAQAGGYGVAGLFVWLYYKERAYSLLLNAKIMEIAIKGAETAGAQTAALVALKDGMEDLSRAVQDAR
jgi:hypothetical protein